MCHTSIVNRLKESKGRCISYFMPDVATYFRTTSSMNHSTVLRDGRVELGGNFEQFGNPCSFDSTDNFTMAFVGADMQTYYFTYPEDSKFANRIDK